MNVLPLDIPQLVTMCFMVTTPSLSLQSTLSRSSGEVEYKGVANVVSESCWLINLLLKLHFPLPQATLVYCDSVNVIYLSGNLVQH